jgi:hypothetical protein
MDRNGHTPGRGSGERIGGIWFILLIDTAPTWRVFISTPVHEQSLLILERKEFVVCNGATAEWKTTIS